MSGAPAPVPFESLLAHRDWVRRLAGTLVRDDASADDVAQRTWLAALRRPPRDVATARAWLGRVARNEASNVRRGERRRAAHEGLAVRADAAPSAADVVAQAESHERVVRAVLALDEPYRTTVLLRWFEDLQPGAVAARMGVPVETVRTRLRRAHETMRGRLGGDGGGGGDGGALRAALAPLLGGKAVALTPAGLSPAAGGAGVAVSAKAAAAGVAIAFGVAVAGGVASFVHARRPDPQTVAAAFVPAPGGALPNVPPPQDPAEDLKARIEAYVGPLAASGLFSGTVLVAKGGEVLVEESWGKADVAAGTANTPATQFKLMSVTKSVTAVAVMRLVQEGKVGLDEPVAKYVPSWPETWKDVTVHQLLDHTSGVPNLENEWAPATEASPDPGTGTWTRVAPSFAGRPVAAPPGTMYAYSNFNYVLLGLVVEKASGRPYADALRDLVLGPAGMTRTGFDDGSRRPGLSIGYFRGKDGVPDPSVQDMSRIQAAGGLYATARDLWLLDRALAAGKILSPATRTTMETAVGAGLSAAYACGWQAWRLHDRPCLHHSGGANGYVADLLRFPDDGACVVVVSNFAFAPAGRIGTDVAALLFGMECDLPKRPAAAALGGWEGVYRAPGGSPYSMLVRRSGATLLAFDVGGSSPRCGGNLLLPYADDRFGRPWGGEKLRFEAAAAGRAAAVRFEKSNVTWERSDPPVAAWRAAAGDYEMAGGGGALLRIRAKGAALTLEDPSVLPKPLTLVPVTETAAIALYMEDFGTLVRLEADAKEEGFRLRWQRNDGRDVEAARRRK